jgi:hypothetical protein
MIDRENTKCRNLCEYFLIEDAVICPKRGSRTRKFSRPQNLTQEITYSDSHNDEAKNKTIAVLPIVFLVLWSFIYTFRVDARALRLGLVMTSAAIVLGVLATGISFTGWQLLFAQFASMLFLVLVIVRQETKTLEWYASHIDNGSIR